MASSAQGTGVIQSPKLTLPGTVAGNPSPKFQLLQQSSGEIHEQISDTTLTSEYHLEKYGLGMFLRPTVLLQNEEGRQ